MQTSCVVNQCSLHRYEGYYIRGFDPKLWFVGYQILQIFSSALVDLSRTWKGSLVQLHMNQAWFHMTVQNSYFGAVTSTKGHLQLSTVIKIL